ncbi:MAG: TetR/AcrR family transcriptional regulator [Anaerolineales bacterium]
MPKVINDKDVYRAVIDVVVASGYESATTQNIADAAGIHEATLFRKYGSKLNLIAQAIKAQFLDVPLAEVVYTGDLQADLYSIIAAYLETSDIVGDILPVLLIEIPRNPELKDSLKTPWENIMRVSKKEPVLNSISVLLGPLMVRHLIVRADLDLSIPAVEPQVYVDNFLHGRLL